MDGRLYCRDRYSLAGTSVASAAGIVGIRFSKASHRRRLDWACQARDPKTRRPGGAVASAGPAKPKFMDPAGSVWKWKNARRIPWCWASGAQPNLHGLHAYTPRSFLAFH